MVGQSRRLSTRGERSSQNSVDPWHARPAIEASDDTPYEMPHQLDKTSNGQYSSLASFLLDHASRVLVLPQSDKL
jgi:hypothetical protein